MDEHQQIAFSCICDENRLTDWERGFVWNIAHSRRLSDKQLAVLRRIYKKVRGY